MTALPDALAGVSARIEQMTALDAPAEFVQRIVRSTFGSGRLDEILGGEPLTHPLHPALVAIPAGSWLSASILDVTGADARAARRLIAFGCLAAVPTAASGARDWSRTVGEQRRIGFAHALLNDAALFTYGASWLARRRGHRARGAGLGLVGAGFLGAAGWLGAHLVFTQRVGVAAGVDPR
jgi:uncharacterized membrane protein